MMEEPEVYQYKCEKCGKHVLSIHKEQFDWNVAAHKKSCRGRDK